MKRIAIQGIKGSFHDIASHHYFEGEQIELICCDTFEQVFQSMKEDRDAIGLVAIENTIAGSLLHNYELLRDSGTTIVGEHKLRISHSIMCLPEDYWADIQEVNSHPVALMQCREFLAAHAGLKIVETTDTAGAAAEIKHMQMRGHAAICHKDAASIYGMKILQEGIETNKHNFTRFSFYKLNLTKIQSLPIIGQEWQYMFYVDLSFSDYARYRQAIEAIKPLTTRLKLLGEYKNGRQDI